MKSWLQLLTLQALLMLLACFQCTIAKEESYPQIMKCKIHWKNGRKITRAMVSLFILNVA